MDGAPRDRERSRLTVALAVAAIVATVALLIAGAVVAPSGDEAAEVEGEGLVVPAAGEVASPTTEVHADHHDDDERVVDTRTVDETHRQHETAAPAHPGAPAEHAAHDRTSPAPPHRRHRPPRRRRSSCRS